MTPTINVNLAMCSCRRPNGEPISVFYDYPDGGNGHLDDCAGLPVPIPCPLPRSVTVAVRLEECECPPHLERSAGAHHHNCPSLPIRVACSISGKTWAESEIREAEIVGRGGMTDAHVAACHARWALVKALVLGSDRQVDEPQAIFSRRDAVFAALADMARLEQEAFDAQEEAIKALGWLDFLPDNFIRAELHQRASASILAEYVERLIEQAGVLP